MTTLLQSEIDALHAEYLRLVGGDLTLSMDRIYWWGQWRLKGWGIEELRLVIGHIQNGIKAKRRNLGALKWSNLIQQIDRYEEEIIEARAEKRNAKPHVTPKERVISQARPTIAPVAPGTTREAKPVGEYIAQLRAAVG